MKAFIFYLKGFCDGIMLILLPIVCLIIGGLFGSIYHRSINYIAGSVSQSLDNDSEEEPKQKVKMGFSID